MSDLFELERAILIDLASQMVWADGTASGEELQELLELDDEMGDEAFQEAMKAARSRSREEVLASAAKIERTEARDLVLTVLHDLASVDGIEEAEAELLAELRKLWA
ncbi:MAG: hypothetical protein JRJ84_20530 [Deltaproteobacteria bacterium]|nr:hypothetical protein [Deltaproteobacteria bacterium]